MNSNIKQTRERTSQSVKQSTQALKEQDANKRMDKHGCPERDGGKRRETNNKNKIIMINFMK